MPIPWADTSLWPASNVCIRAAVHRNQKNLASYLCDRSAREILLSIGDMFVLSILFKNRWWWLFHRRRRVKTVRSNQRKHLKSGLTCIKPQQSCLISTVVASQRLPTWQLQDEDCSSSPPHCSCCSCRSHVCRRLWRRGGPLGGFCALFFFLSGFRQPDTEQGWRVWGLWRRLWGGDTLDYFLMLYWLRRSPNWLLLHPYFFAGW